jgi:hypothetical protein
VLYAGERALWRERLCGDEAEDVRRAQAFEPILRRRYGARLRAWRNFVRSHYDEIYGR